MPRLQINRTIADVEIGKRIDCGQELVLELGQTGAVKTHEDFHEFHQAYQGWAAGVQRLLNDFFEGASALLTEWEELGIGNIDDNVSRGQNMKILRQSADRGVEWLTDLRNRLPDFSMSPSTPILG